MSSFVLSCSLLSPAFLSGHAVVWYVDIYPGIALSTRQVRQRSSSSVFCHGFAMFVELSFAAPCTGPTMGRGSKSSTVSVRPANFCWAQQNRQLYETCLTIWLPWHQKRTDSGVPLSTHQFMFSQAASDVPKSWFVKYSLDACRWTSWPCKLEKADDLFKQDLWPRGVLLPKNLYIDCYCYLKKEKQVNLKSSERFLKQVLVSSTRLHMLLTLKSTCGRCAAWPQALFPGAKHQ